MDIAHLALSKEAPGPAAAADAVRWLTEKKREEVYALQFPFELAGVEYREVAVRRLSAGEVEAFLDKMRGSSSPEAMRLPMYFVGGEELTDAVWDALDDDDVFGLEKAAIGLLPARFRRDASS